MAFKIKNPYGAQQASQGVAISPTKVVTPAKDIDAEGRDRPLTAAQQAADDKKKDFSLEVSGRGTKKKKPYVKKGGKATGNMKDYKIGSAERRAEYEARGWKQDKTTEVKKEVAKPVSEVKPKDVVKNVTVTGKKDDKVEPKKETSKRAGKLRAKGEAVLADKTLSIEEKQRQAGKLRKKYDKKNAKVEKKKDRKERKVKYDEKTGTGGSIAGNLLRSITGKRKKDRKAAQQKKKDDSKEVVTLAKYKSVTKMCGCGKKACKGNCGK